MANPTTSHLGYVVAERHLVPPSSISPDARAVLATRPDSPPDFPPQGDHQAWQAFASAADQDLIQLLGPRLEAIPGKVTELAVHGVRVIEIVPPGVDPDDDRLYLDLHGGALISGSGNACRLMAKMVGSRLATRLWSIDYRMPPAHPYPAALDDCLSVYSAALLDRRPGSLIVGGISAGANLAAALTLRARDQGLPLPAAVALLSPELDLTESGDSFSTLAGVDVVLVRSLMQVNLLYADGHELSHPYLSPLFGDFDKGFPPTFLSAGTRDLFLSNAARMHRGLRRAGIAAELHVFEAMPHGGFTGSTSEDGDLWAELRRFIADHWR